MARAVEVAAKGRTSFIVGGHGTGEEGLPFEGVSKATEAKVIPIDLATKLGEGDTIDLVPRLDADLFQIDDQPHPFSGCGQFTQRAVAGGIDAGSPISDPVFSPEAAVFPGVVDVDLQHHRLGRRVLVEVDPGVESVSPAHGSRFTDMNEKVLGDAIIRSLLQTAARSGMDTVLCSLDPIPVHLRTVIDDHSGSGDFIIAPDPIFGCGHEVVGDGQTYTPQGMPRVAAAKVQLEGDLHRTFGSPGIVTGKDGESSFLAIEAFHCPTVIERDVAIDGGTDRPVRLLVIRIGVFPSNLHRLAGDFSRVVYGDRFSLDFGEDDVAVARAAWAFPRK